MNVDAGHYFCVNMAYGTLSHLNTTKFYKIIHRLFRSRFRSSREV